MAEETRDWRELPEGTWFFLASPDCVEPYSVQERTEGGYSMVCSTPYVHERAKRQMQEIAKLHNALASDRRWTEEQFGNIGSGFPPFSAEEALVIEIARELYDRFVMGGWEPQDAYPLIRKWIADLREQGGKE